jgi:hypothetical protein
MQEGYISEDEIRGAALAGDVERCRALLDASQKTAFKFGPVVFQQFCEQGNAAACRAMIEAGIFIDSNGPDKTPLMIAAGAGQAHVCEVLIAAAAKLNSANVHGETALSIACEERHVEVVRLLLRSGARPDPVSFLGKTPLMVAANCGDAEVCAALIAGGAKLGLASYAGMTALAISIFHNKLDAFKVLSAPTKERVFVDGLGKGLTPFQFAIKCGAVDIAEHLIAACAENVAQRTASGRTMMQLAGTNQMVKDLLHGARTSQLVDVAIEARPEGMHPQPAAPAPSKGMSPL